MELIIKKNNTKIVALTETSSSFPQNENVDPHPPPPPPPHMKMTMEMGPYFQFQPIAAHVFVNPAVFYILSAVIISDKLTGRSKGYDFVTFKEPEKAKKACKDATPVINCGRANCNLASLWARRHRFASNTTHPPQRGSNGSHGGGVLVGVPKEFRCPIFEELMADPVVLATGEMDSEASRIHWLCFLHDIQRHSQR
ncbi:hypothetical protein ACFX13_047262 [Malus domestica]